MRYTITAQFDTENFNYFEWVYMMESISRSIAHYSGDDVDVHTTIEVSDDVNLDRLANLEGDDDETTVAIPLVA